MSPPIKVAIFAQLLQGRAGGIEINLTELLGILGAASADVYPIAIGPGESSQWLHSRVANGNVLPWPVIRFHPQDSLWAREHAPLPERVGALLRRALARRSAKLAGAGHHVAAGLRLSAALRAQGVEVVHFPYQRYFETDLPFIFEPWDLQHIHYPENFSDQEVRFREHLYREACERATLVVAPTRWGKRDLVAKFGIEARRVAVIARGPGALPAADEPGTLVRPLPARYIVYPAKFWRHKNHLGLFAALGHLRASGCVVPLVCTGDPESAVPAHLRQSILSHGLQEQVLFAGHLERAALTAVLRQAEFLVFPSLFEGLGIPVLEAMSLGVPVACSRIGPLDEIASGAAEPFDANDPLDIARAIEALWSDAERRIQLKLQGRRRAQAQDWRQVARDFVICYKRAAGRALAKEDEARFSSLIE